jgi:pyruvate formate lyase activating enzyme
MILQAAAVIREIAKMGIKGFVPMSLVDWDGKVSSVIFLDKCNFNCGFCSNKDLVIGSGEKEIPFENILAQLEKNKNFIDGVVITGGEPTLLEGLADLCRKVKEKGFLVKIDTNGSNPEVLWELNKLKIIDSIAMDVKAPKEFYSGVAGRDVRLEDIEKSIKIVSQFPDYEFRTTIIPLKKREEEGFNFMSIEDVLKIAKWIVEITGLNNHKFFLQKFVPREDGLIDKRLEDFPETSGKLLTEMQDEVKKVIPGCRVRGV